MVDQLPLDLHDSRDLVEEALRAELSRLLAGTADQVDGPIRDCANRLIVAARRGDRAIADECRDQLQMAVEERKLGARSGLESVLNVFFSTGIGLLFNGLVAGLAAVKGRT